MRNSTFVAAPCNQRGFGLAELMVALVVMAIAMVAVFGTFFRSQRSTQRITAVVEKRQMARSAVQLIERDIRMAGSGWGRLAVSGCYNGAQLTLNSTGPGYGGVASQDSISLVGGFDANTTLSAAMANLTADISVVNVTGFAVGDLVAVTNGASADMFQITQIAGSAIKHANTSLFDVAGGHVGWPPGGYGTGARVYRLTWLIYKVDSTSFRKPALVRWEVTKSSQLVAYDVRQFQVRYDMQDGSTTRNPATPAMIDRIIPVITMRTPSMQNQPAIDDSAWAVVVPRTF